MPYRVTAVTEDVWLGLPKMTTGSRMWSQLPVWTLDAHSASGLGRNLAAAVAVLLRKRIVVPVFVLTQRGLTLRRVLVPGRVHELYVVPVRDFIGEGHRVLP